MTDPDRGPPRTPEASVTIARFDNPAEADLVRSLLKAQSIATRLVDDSSGPNPGPLPIHMDVAGADAARAAVALREYQDRRDEVAGPLAAHLPVRQFRFLRKWLRLAAVLSALSLAAFEARGSLGLGMPAVSAVAALRALPAAAAMSLLLGCAVALQCTLVWFVIHIIRYHRRRGR